MTWVYWVAIITSLGALIAGVCLLAVSFRTSVCTPADRFTQGWLGVFGFLLSLGSGLGLVAIVGSYTSSSPTAFAVVIALNLLGQPVALLLFWLAARKIGLGLRGCVAYAWARIPETELTHLPRSERRLLARHCVFQGLVALLFGAVISIAFAAPLFN